MFINETPFDERLLKEVGKRFHVVIYRYTIAITLVCLVAALGFVYQNLPQGIVFASFALLVPLIIHLIMPAILLSKNKKKKTNQLMKTSFKLTPFLDDDFLIGSSNQVGYEPLRNPYLQL